MPCPEESPTLRPTAGTGPALSLGPTDDAEGVAGAVPPAERVRVESLEWPKLMFDEPTASLGEPGTRVEAPEPLFGTAAAPAGSPNALFEAPRVARDTPAGVFGRVRELDDEPTAPVAAPKRSLAELGGPLSRLERFSRTLERLKPSEVLERLRSLLLGGNRMGAREDFSVDAPLETDLPGSGTDWKLRTVGEGMLRMV